MLVLVLVKGSHDREGVVVRMVEVLLVVGMTLVVTADEFAPYSTAVHGVNSAIALFAVATHFRGWGRGCVLVGLGLFVVVTGGGIFCCCRSRLRLLLGLHPPVLEPDLDLPLGEAQAVGDLDAAPPGQVAVVVELLLQLQGLVPRVGLSRSLWTVLTQF